MSATKPNGRPLDRGRGVNGQMIRTNGGIANQPRVTDQGFNGRDARREAPSSSGADGTVRAGLLIGGTDGDSR